MKRANPYLNFNGNTEEAFNFYREVFGGEFLGVIRFRDFDANVMEIPEGDRDRIAHIALPLGANLLMGTDVLESRGQKITMGNNSYIHVEGESSEEAKRLFDGLSAGGGVEMPLQKTEWAELYGICIDRFGVQWMVDYTGSVQFSGASGG